MTKLRADEDHLEDVEEFLGGRERCTHLRARRRGDAIIVESGPDAGASPHVRLRRIGVHRWALDVADHRGRWEPTPYTGTLEGLLTQAVGEFAWVLEPKD